MLQPNTNNVGIKCDGCTVKNVFLEGLGDAFTGIWVSGDRFGPTSVSYASVRGFNSGIFVNGDATISDVSIEWTGRGISNGDDLSNNGGIYVNLGDNVTSCLNTEYDIGENPDLDGGIATYDATGEPPACDSSLDACMACPSEAPTQFHSSAPSVSNAPSASSQPSSTPSQAPSTVPSAMPSLKPSAAPSSFPSGSPSATPSLSMAPSLSSAPSVNTCDVESFLVCATKGSNGGRTSDCIGYAETKDECLTNMTFSAAIGNYGPSTSTLTDVVLRYNYVSEGVSESVETSLIGSFEDALDIPVCPLEERYITLQCGYATDTLIVPVNICKPGSLTIDFTAFAWNEVGQQACQSKSNTASFIFEDRGFN